MQACGLGAGIAAGLLPPPAAAQARDRIHALSGEVRINGRPADLSAAVRAGDTVATGPSGQMRFVLNGDAFFLRSGTELTLERRRPGDRVISGLRILSGAIGAAFAKGGDRRIFAPTVTAGIRGTGVYVETRPDTTYFCTCYGAVELEATVGGGRDRVFVVSGNHHARRIGADAAAAMRIQEAPFQNHTNDEMIALEAAAGRPNPFSR